MDILTYGRTDISNYRVASLIKTMKIHEKTKFLDQNVNKPRLASSEPTEVTLADIAEVILADIPEADSKEAELELIKEDKLLKIKEYIFG